MTQRGERADDYRSRRAHLGELSEAELEERFWSLCNELTEPLVSLAESHTSPSIERSVLLRMGFSSLEAKEIVQRCVEHGLLGKGAGHVVLKTARARGAELLETGRRLAGGELWQEALELFPRSRASK